MKSSDAKRLKELEDRGIKTRRDRPTDTRPTAEKPTRARRGGAARPGRVSERRACRVVGILRSTQRLVPPPVTDDEAELRAFLRKFATQRPRWGWRRAAKEARRQGRQVNDKRVRRLWREEGLRVPTKKRKKRLTGVGVHVGAMGPIRPNGGVDSSRHPGGEKKCASRGRGGGGGARGGGGGGPAGDARPPVYVRMDNGPELASPRSRTGAGHRTGACSDPGTLTERASRLIDLTAIATGPANTTGMGPESRARISPNEPVG